MQINPPEPSFTIFSNVCWIFICASSGIQASFACNPSFTSSCRLLPKMLEFQISLGLFSNCESRDFTKSSLCFSLPTIGEISVSTSVLIKWIEGAFAFNFTPYFEPCFTISGSSKISSSIEGVIIPYPFDFTDSKAGSTLSYCFLIFANLQNEENSSYSLEILLPESSLKIL